MDRRSSSSVGRSSSIAIDRRSSSSADRRASISTVQCAWCSKVQLAKSRDGCSEWGKERRNESIGYSHGICPDCRPSFRSSGQGEINPHPTNA